MIEDIVRLLCGFKFSEAAKNLSESVPSEQGALITALAESFGSPGKPGNCSMSVVIHTALASIGIPAAINDDGSYEPPALDDPITDKNLNSALVNWRFVEALESGSGFTQRQRAVLISLAVIYGNDSDNVSGHQGIIVRAALKTIGVVFPNTARSAEAKTASVAFTAAKSQME